MPRQCSCTHTLGWDVLPVGVTRDGHWLVGLGALERPWADADSELLPAGSVPADQVVGAGGPVDDFDGPPPLSALARYRMALPVCHGHWGEDGTLQGLLRCYGLRIVGCGVTASAICFDKQLAKAVLGDAGLPVARGVLVREVELAADPCGVIERIRDAVGAEPWFVKPARGGSSLGIASAHSAAELREALGRALGWDDAALVEELIPHRELVLGVLGRRHLTVSPPGECIPMGALYTYEEKYRLGNPRFTCPAAIDARLTRQAQELAADAFRVLGCSVFARVDLFLDRRTGDFLINEVNTIPGMTAASVFPKVMQAAGYPYPDLLVELCRLATDG